MDRFSNLRLLREAARAAADLAKDLDVGPLPDPEPAAAPGYVSIAEAARHFGVSAHTVRRRVLAREWPSVRVGRQIRIDLDAITKSRKRNHPSG